jgi:hypothetical protein
MYRRSVRILFANARSPEVSHFSLFSKPIVVIDLQQLIHGKTPRCSHSWRPRPQTCL